MFAIILFKENNKLSHNLSALNLKEEGKSNEEIKYAPKIKSKLKNLETDTYPKLNLKIQTLMSLASTTAIIGIQILIIFNRPLDSSPYKISFNPSYYFSRPLPLDPS